jgi:hypothetical protein
MPPHIRAFALAAGAGIACWALLLALFYATFYDFAEAPSSIGELRILQAGFAVTYFLPVVIAPLFARYVARRLSATPIMAAVPFIVFFIILAISPLALGVLSLGNACATGERFPFDVSCDLGA